MSKTEESGGCAVGELIKLDDDESVSNKAVEVFLAERSRDWGGGARGMEMGGQYKGGGGKEGRV